MKCMRKIAVRVLKFCHGHSISTCIIFNTISGSTDNSSPSTSDPDIDIYICIYSALFGNLHNFEIALCILSIAKLCTNFEIAYAILKSCNKSMLCNLEMEVAEQDTRQCWICCTANYLFAHYIHVSS